VLLWTGADEHIEDPEKYWQLQGGLSVQGLNYLLDQGIKLIGLDAYAINVSFDTMEAAKDAGDPDFFPLHFVGRARQHMHLEKLTNLGAILRPTGFFFVTTPMKLRGGSAGWVRPVALVPTSDFTDSERASARD